MLVIAVPLLLALAFGEEEAYPSDEYRKARPRRIFGAGIGIFLLVFFFFVSCGVCWGGTLVPEEYVEQQWVFKVLGTVIFSSVALLLLFAEEEPRYESREEETRGYDDNLLGLLVVLFFMVVAAAVGLASIFYYHCLARVEAPMDHRRPEKTGIFSGTCQYREPLPSFTV